MKYRDDDDDVARDGEVVRDPNENLIRRHLATETNAAAQAKRDAVWEQYRNDLGNAWRQGRTDPSRADEIERQRQRWTAER
jgi:hypothetical protein